MVFGDRTKNVRKIRPFPDRPRFVGYPRVRSCAQRRKCCSSVTGHLQKKARSPWHSMGPTWRSDHLWVRRVSAMMITLSCAFKFCDEDILSEHISTSLSIPSPWNGVCEKTTFGPFITNSFYNLVIESSVSRSPFLSRIKHLAKMSSCHHTRFKSLDSAYT